VPEGEIVAHSLVSRPGDAVCVYSVGVSGAKKRNGELFGDEAVVDIVRKGYYLSAADLASTVLRAVSEREERGANADDRTVQVLKIE
ncbi:MAG TPA: SpoIIE family protein phosphatase, partial [Treponemataceae bacterium]|nr:SpoIIE family protein phosphatase [Treponemataceae bacterium]